MNVNQKNRFRLGVFRILEVTSIIRIMFSNVLYLDCELHVQHIEGQTSFHRGLLRPR